MTSGKFATTLGYERRTNPALQFTDPKPFIAYMTSGQPARPANIQNIVAINQGRRPLTLHEPQVTPLSAATAETFIRDGGLVLDTRCSRAFSEGHLDGAYSIQLSSGEFEQRVGWVLPPDRDFMMVVERLDEAERAVHKLAFVGLDSRVRGTLTMQAWREAGRSEKKLAQLGVEELSRELQRGTLQLLDVREPAEWQAGHIAASRPMSFKQLEGALAALALDPGRPVAVVCATGKRSSTGASILARNGYRQVANVTGGMAAWERAGLPVERS